MTYVDEDGLRQAVAMQVNDRRLWNKALIFVPGSEEFSVVFDDELGRLKAAGGPAFTFPSLLCADMMYSNTLEGRLKAMEYEGVLPTAGSCFRIYQRFQGAIRH